MRTLQLAGTWNAPSRLRTIELQDGCERDWIALPEELESMGGSSQYTWWNDTLGGQQ